MSEGQKTGPQGAGKKNVVELMFRSPCECEVYKYVYIARMYVHCGFSCISPLYVCDTLEEICIASGTVDRFLLASTAGVCYIYPHE